MQQTVEVQGALVGNMARNALRLVGTAEDLHALMQIQLLKMKKTVIQMKNNSCVFYATNLMVGLGRGIRANYATRIYH